ncbi:Hypothetical protein A7982_03264 [Minicystis rosea]|nr:Hypothetical protein A7982_03264 [Minicystis rosea]
MHVEAGPLHPTDSMLELLRLSRALGAAPGARTLDVAAVHAIETELGATLPDDALIVLTMGDGDLACATGLALDAILDAAEDWGDGVPDDHVAIAFVYEDPFAEREEDAHGGAYEVIAIPRDASRSSSRVLIVRDGHAEEETTLAAFAREKIAAWYSRDSASWLSALQREAALPLADDTFRPALVGALPVARAEPVRFVAHPKFGRGRVLETRTENGETKLVIAFETAGQKTLLARFVSDV